MTATPAVCRKLRKIPSLRVGDDWTQTRLTVAPHSLSHGGLHSTAGWFSGTQASNEVWEWDKERATDLSGAPDQDCGLLRSACLKPYICGRVDSPTAVLFCRFFPIPILSANPTWSWAGSPEWQWTGVSEKLQCIPTDTQKQTVGANQSLNTLTRRFIWNKKVHFFWLLNDQCK